MQEPLSNVYFYCSHIYHLIMIIFISTRRGEAVKQAPTVSEEEWLSEAGMPYVSEAGWYFKTLAAQEIGKCTKR